MNGTISSTIWREGGTSKGGIPPFGSYIPTLRMQQKFEISTKNTYFIGDFCSDNINIKGAKIGNLTKAIIYSAYMD